MSDKPTQGAMKLAEKIFPVSVRFNPDGDASADLLKRYNETRQKHLTSIAHAIDEAVGPLVEELKERAEWCGCNEMHNDIKDCEHCRNARQLLAEWEGE